MTKYLLKITLLTSLLFAQLPHAAAQLSLSWFDDCKNLTDFTEEPPVQNTNTDNKIANGYHNCIVSDSFGNILFNAYTEFKNGKNDFDTFKLKISTANQPDILLKTQIRPAFKETNKPHVVKAEGKGNIYHIIWFDYPRNGPIYRNSILVYYSYDAASGKLVNEQAISIGDTIFNQNANKLSSLKTIRYPDGSAYLLRYIREYNINQNDSMVLYRLYKDSVQTIGYINNVKWLKINTFQVFYFQADFYHHSKAFVTLSKDGLKKISFDGDRITANETLLPAKGELNDYVYANNLVLSPNDSFLYLPLYIWVQEPILLLVQIDLTRKKIAVDSTVLNRYSYETLFQTPNGKIFIDNIPRYIIQQPNLAMPYCKIQKINPKYYPCRSIFKNSYTNGLNYIEPSQYVWFKNSFNCTDTLLFSNRSDSIFKQFEWHIENLSQKTNKVYTNKNLKLATKNGDTLFVKLKGIAKNGHSLWFSDSVFVKHLHKPSLVKNIPDSICNYNVFANALQLQFDKNDSRKSEKYIWTLNGAGYHNKVLNDSKIQLKPSQTGALQVKLSYRNKNACNLDTQLVMHIIEAPKPGVNLSDTQACTPAIIYASSTDSGEIKSRKLEWKHGPSSNDTAFSTSFNSVGNYQIVQSLVGPNGCITKDSAKLRISAGFSKSDSTELLYASVIDSQLVELKWNKRSEGMAYILYQQNKEQSADSVIITDAWQDSYIDSVPQSLRLNSYQYRINIMDSCHQLGKISNLAQTIALQYTNYNNAYVVLTWNAYKDWQKGVKEYLVESATDAQNWQALNSLTENYDYTDNRITQLNNEYIYYRVKAIEQDGNQQSSYSNIVKVPIQASLIVPNAFSPNGDGINDIFKVGHFGFLHFECKIFSRNGQIVAYSNNPDNIWDGKHYLGDYPAGTYSYTINASDQKGQAIKHQGTLVLIR